MKYGAIFPTTEIGSDPSAIRDWAQAAEGLGYSHIVTYDHVLGAERHDRARPLVGPYDENDPFHEPMTLLAFLAGVTSKVELSTGILILPQRQTALVAKQAAEIDLLSRGRMRLAVGSGWNHVEYESLGMEFDDRGSRLSEQVELLRLLFRDRIVDYSGKYHRVERAGLLPSPRADLPIWFGGYSAPAFARAARQGDGFFFGSPPRKSADLALALRNKLHEEGRGDSEFGLEASIDFSHDPDDWQADLRAWEGVGGTHVCLRAMDTGAKFVGGRTVGFAGPADYINALETFRSRMDFA